RLRRELALLVRRAAFSDVAEEKWALAAKLLSVDGVAELDGLVHAMVQILGGRRADGIRLLAEASQRNPRDRRLTHTLALARLHSLSAGYELELDWAQCIATWVSVLHDDEFWAVVLADAGRRYGVDIEADLVEPLRIGLRDLLVQRLPTNGSRPVGADPTLLFQRELAAAEVLAGGGGFPLPNGDDAPDSTKDDDTLVCGPLRLAELGLHREFGRFTVQAVGEMARNLDELTESTHPEVRRQVALLVGAKNQLVRCFSALGFAHCHLVADRPADALAELADLRCADCRTVTRAASADPLRPLVCEPGCARFDRDNPAYAALDDGRERLSDDAVELAVDALCTLAQTELTSAEPDLTEVGKYWRRAVTAAIGIDIGDEVQQRVTELAMGRSDTLNRRDKLPQSIQVLETVLPVLDGDRRDRVAGQLANLLANRGIRAANKSMDDTTTAIADLGRAVVLNPHLIRARSSLGVLLHHRAAKLLDSGDVAGAQRQLLDLINLLKVGVREAPGQRELTDLLAKVTEDHNKLIAALAAAYQRAGRRR
ncbi:MAG TPA: hypothetical protein VH352_16310, partial [Pseudonocardiaceae bacterium]|nr:hypothetical protein [Pseudonocardiaceae bacterium]